MGWCSMIKAVIFDIGQTLAYYPIPLNWSSKYRPAFEQIATDLDLTISEKEFAHIGQVLSKYNTRINPRTKEVSSDVIFTEILSGTSIPMSLLAQVKHGFYSFFRTDVVVYPEAEEVLSELKRREIKIATYSDVAYGMDNVYALEDISPLLKYIDLPYTSNDTGFRKQSAEGVAMIAAALGVAPSEILFVGDEIKDMQCAAVSGATGILINRTTETKDYGQDHEIRSLTEVLSFL